MDFSALGFPAWELGRRWLCYGKPAQMSRRVVELGAQPVTHKQHTTKTQREETRAGGLAAVRAPCWSRLSLRPPQAAPKKRASPRTGISTPRTRTGDFYLHGLLRGFLTPKRRLGDPARKPLYLNRHLDVGGWAVVSGDARCKVSVVHFLDVQIQKKTLDLETPPSEPRSLPRPVVAVLIPVNPMGTPQFVVDSQSGFLKFWIWGSGPRGPRKQENKPRQSPL